MQVLLTVLWEDALQQQVLCLHHTGQLPLGPDACRHVVLWGWVLGWGNHSAAMLGWGSELEVRDTCAGVVRTRFRIGCSLAHRTSRCNC